MESLRVYGPPFASKFMMNPESIYYLFEAGTKDKQKDYIWPVAGKATANDKVFIVCSSARSYYNGDTASKLIGQFMAAKALKFSEREMSGKLIDKLLIEARERLITYARINRLDSDLAATFSMCILYDQKIFLSWYGDNRIYHMRAGEILFRTDAAVSAGINADLSPIHAETKWIDDVQEGDYFLLCSKGLAEHVTDDEIQRLAFEKSSDNYSMYLIRIHLNEQESSIDSKLVAIEKQTSRMRSPILILALTVVGLLIMVLFFRQSQTPDPIPAHRSPTTQALDVPGESVPDAIVLPVRRSVSRVTDSVKNKEEKPPVTPKVTDSVKSLDENPPANPPVESAVVPKYDPPETIQPEEKPEPVKQTPVVQKKGGQQLLLKFTTDESCKLKITNLDLDEVIDWDLSQDDNGTLYLKPGKYLILATSETNSFRTKTYNFDVKPGNTHTTQNLHIHF